MKRLIILSLLVYTAILVPSSTQAAIADNVLRVGWAQVDITPEKPVALFGQMYKRISKDIRDPLTATALALETKSPNGSKEQAIMISCDVLFIRKVIQEKIRALVKPQISDFDVDKLFLNATHTHTGPGFIDGAANGLYDVSGDPGVMKASEYAEFFVNRVSRLIIRAWGNRKPGAISWALGHAAVGYNRRSHYFDGRSVMYGDMRLPDFSNIEGYQDHGIEMLFLWDDQKNLTGIVINVACPAQETEHLYEISADFWHDVRIEIRKRLSKDVFILPQCAAAGDLSPHLLLRNRAEQIMAERRGISRRQEIARRIANAVEDVLPCANKDTKTSPIFKHTVARINLPSHKPNTPLWGHLDTVEPVEIHILCLDDVAIATNPFELYVDYGIRMKTRSPAVLTFVVQVACQCCGYLPTERAVRGGGYSAKRYIVDPEGGQVLVNETLKHINALWD
jgi:hypothetical protein